MGCSSSKSEATSTSKIEDIGSTTSISTISNDEMEDAYRTVEEDDNVNPGELRIFWMKSKQFLKSSVKKIVNTNIFVIGNKSKLDDIAKQLMIVGNMCDVLENKTTQKRVQGYQRQVVDWLIEIKLDELCCRTICYFSNYRGKNSDVFENGSVLVEIVNSCLTILLSYCEISHTFAVKIGKKKHVLEFVKTMLLENHKNITEEEVKNNEEFDYGQSEVDGGLEGDDDFEENERFEGDEDSEDDELFEGDEDFESDELFEGDEDFDVDERFEVDEDFENDGRFECDGYLEGRDQYDGDEYVEDDEQDEGNKAFTVADDTIYDAQVTDDEQVECDEDGHCAEDSYYGQMVLKCLLLLYHTSLYEDNVTRLRSLELLPVLSPYMSSQHGLLALVTVANIVNEKECKIINKIHVESLLEILEDCLNSKTGKDGGWSAYQCGLAVRRLARNDENHALLLECNVLPFIVKLASDGRPEEQLEGVTALRYLTFNKEAKEKIVNDQKIGVVETLNELCKSDNDKIKEESFGALWTLRSDLEISKVKEYRKIAKRLEKPKSFSAASDGTLIMISYQWDDQKLAKKVTSILTKKGYKGVR